VICMRALRTLFALLLAGGLASADDAADRTRLVGTWLPQDKSGTSWVVKSDGEGLHLTKTQDDQKLLDFECNTVGRECEVKGPRKETKVSMWYSGPRLVLMETSGSDVVKYRFHATDADKLEVDVIPIVPDGKPQSISLARQAQTPGTNR
jgi:hypothetical protein